MRGKLILPADAPLYDRSRQMFNARIQRHPAAVARCASVADVRACVQFCAANGIAVSIRCGSHGALGYAVEDNQLMIDMTGLQYVKVNLKQQTVEVGGGSLWGQVDLATYSRGLAAPGGGCPVVGVGGLAQGGGFGPIARTHGLTCDNIVSARIMLASGEHVTLSEQERPDLFWALRGGGGGNLGVVTSFTFRLYPIEGALAGGTLIYDWSNAKAMLQVYRDWMRDPQGDERLTMLPGLGFGPDGSPLALLTAFYNGEWQAGQAYIQKNILANLPQPAIPADLGPLTLPSFTATEATTAWPGLGAYWRNGFLKNEFSDKAIDTILTWFNQAPAQPTGDGRTTNPGRQGDLTFCFIESLGGAIGRVAPTDTAFVHRDSLFSFTIIGVYPPSEQALGEATKTWSAQFRQAMEPYLSGGVYVNYMQDDLPNWRQAYYGENYPRLRACKQECDPNHLFRFPQDLLQD
jgi:FAD/FMN-containing dehydrogenase